MVVSEEMRPFTKGEGSRRGGGSVAAAAVGGASQGGLLDQAVETLLQVTQGDRVGVWLEEPGGSDTLLGVVRDRSGNATPHEWTRLAADLPFLRPVYARGRTHEPVLVGGQSEALIGPMLEMQQAAWVPIRQREHAVGVVFAATRRRGNSFSAVPLERVAAELALALEAGRERGARLERDADLQFTRNTLEKILRGDPLAEALKAIVRNCVEQIGAEFAVIGHGQGSDMKFVEMSGALDRATAVEDEGLRQLWRKALEEGRVIGADAQRWGLEPGDDSDRPGEVARVVALPLDGAEKKPGVLIAGLRKNRGSLAVLERLELRAHLAAAALVLEMAREEGPAEAGRWRSWMASTGENLLALNEDGVVCEASQGALELLDLDEPKPEGSHLEDLFAPPTGIGIAIWNAAAAAGDPEALRRSAQGILRNGRQVRLLAEPGKRVEESRWRVWLQPSEALADEHRAESELRTVVEWLDQGLVLFDGEGWVRAANSRFAQVMGLAPGEMQGLATIDALVKRLAEQTANPREFARCWREEAMRGETGARDEIHLLRPAPRELERLGRPVFSQDGNRIGWLELYRDLTPQRLFQSKLVQTEKLASLGQMVTNVAHELGSLLTSITGYAQRLLERPTGPHVRDDLNRIHHEADRASRMMRNVLLIARDTKPKRRLVNLNESVRRAIDLRRYELELDHIRVETHLAGDLPDVMGDPDQLQQVVINLVVNAEQAIEEGPGRGTIRVRTGATEGQRVRLEIADNGPGIPAAVLTRIFDPFFTTKPAGVGTGLGLSIVHSIVRQHGGRIHAESPPEGGALFVVELPGLARGAHRTTERAGTSVAARQKTAPEETGSVPHAARSGRVLVVEDEPTVARLIADVLVEEGHEVVSLLDSREALERVLRERFDLVICDVKMPGLDGRQFYESLARAASPLCNRIIFVTGDTLTPHTVEFLERNRLPYLAKPFRVEELRRTVGRILCRKRAQAAGGDRTSELTEGRIRKT